MVPARLWAGCEAVAHRLFLEERRRGVRRPHGQRMADALLILMRIARGELDPRVANQPTAADARGEDPAGEHAGEACGPANADDTSTDDPSTADEPPAGAERTRERFASAHPPDPLPLFRPPPSAPGRPRDPDEPRPEPDLADLARAALGRGLNTKILVRIDHAALVRGHTDDAEV